MAFRIQFFITGKNIEFTHYAAVIVFSILRMALPMQSLIYWVLSLKRLYEHLANLNEFSSSLTGTSLSWLKNFLWILGIIMFTWLNLLFFRFHVIEQFTGLIYLFSIFFLSYFAFRQKEVFDYKKQELTELSEILRDTHTPQKTRKKRISHQRMQELDTNLKTIMFYDKIYIESELTLPELATKISATSNELSYLINQLYNENFHNFINKHRVEEAKTLLLSEQFSTMNIIEIAYQSGFNSKTTFNTMFKKHTGLSPTAFIKKHSLIRK